MIAPFKYSGKYSFESFSERFEAKSDSLVFTNKEGGKLSVPLLLFTFKEADYSC